MIEKIYCKLCSIHKSNEEFTKSELKRKTPRCKECCRDRHKKYYKEHREELLIYNKQYRTDNAQEIKEKDRRYLSSQKNRNKKNEKRRKTRENNKDRVNAKKRELYLNNIENYRAQARKRNKNNKKGKAESDKKSYNKRRDKILAQKKEYNRINKEKVRETQRKCKKKIKNDPIRNLRKLASRAINHLFEANNSSKNGKSILKYLPYSMQELKLHIESQFEYWMTWKNRGAYKKDQWDDNDPTTWKWQLDHIEPQANFSCISMEDENFKKCWALENLRPYSAKQNVIDGARRIRHKLFSRRK